MSDGRPRRSELLDRLADHILSEGLEAASLRPLARAAGTSDRMLLYYFRDKAELIDAALNRLVQRLTALLASAVLGPLPFQALEERLRAVLLDKGLRPYMALWLEIAARAARDDPAWRARGRTIAEGLLAWVEAQLAPSPEEERSASALRLLTVLEGAVLLAAVGLIPRREP